MSIRNGAYRIDLHVHTGRYSWCAECLDPYQIGTYAAQAGLSGVVLTEHDVFWQEEEIELLRAGTPGITIYRGIEVSAKDCHLVVVGIDEAAPLARGLEVAEVVGHVRQQGGAVILAHPFRDSDPATIPVQLVDAVEVGSTSFTKAESDLARDLSTRVGKPAVASSDAHALSRIGWAWTEFSFLPPDERTLAEAIRKGRGRPVIPALHKPTGKE